MFFIEYIEWFFNNFYFIFTATFGSLCLKLCILFFLIHRTISLRKIERPFFFLFIIIISNMFSDFAWVLQLSKILFFPQLNYKIILFFTHIAWMFFIIQYQSLVLFIESLVVQF